jgi:hypothetical protein
MFSMEYCAAKYRDCEGCVLGTVLSSTRVVLKSTLGQSAWLYLFVGYCWVETRLNGLPRIGTIVCTVRCYRVC